MVKEYNLYMYEIAKEQIKKKKKLDNCMWVMGQNRQR